MKLDKKAKAGIPRAQAHGFGHKINQHHRLLAANIRAARPEAKQGDIFSPEISQEFKRLIATLSRGPMPRKRTRQPASC